MFALKISENRYIVIHNIICLKIALKMNEFDAGAKMFFIIILYLICEIQILSAYSYFWRAIYIYWQIDIYLWDWK